MLFPLFSYLFSTNPAKIQHPKSDVKGGVSEKLKSLNFLRWMAELSVLVILIKRIPTLGFECDFGAVAGDEGRA